MKDDVMSALKITKNPYAFACQWYQPAEIHRCINRSPTLQQLGYLEPIPEDTKSMEFAEWLAGQYRLAMAKGAELAIEELKNGR